MTASATAGSASVGLLVGGRCDIDAVVARLTKESVAAAWTQGYVTGLGGAITLAKGMPILGGIAGGP